MRLGNTRRSYSSCSLPSRRTRSVSWLHGLPWVLGTPWVHGTPWVYGHNCLCVVCHLRYYLILLLCATSVCICQECMLAFNTHTCTHALTHTQGYICESIKFNDVTIKRWYTSLACTVSEKEK